jgi:hypothetical protein
MKVLFQIAVIALMLVSSWKVFEKAGKPGWVGIIPIYNMFVILELVGKPTWWIILFFVPIVNLVIAIITYIAFAERFGKSAGFGVGLALLGFIFLPILAFGDAQYMSGGAGTPPAAPM